MCEVFIRYGAEDAAAADRLCTYLAEKGAECYRASGRITPASAASVRHNEAISSMKAYILMCGESAPAEASSELYLAKGREDVRVIVCRTTEAPFPEGLGNYLDSAEMVDFTEASEEALARAGKLVEEQLGRFPKKNEPSAQPGIQPSQPEERPKKSQKPFRIGVVLITLAAVFAVFGGGMAFLFNTRAGHKILDRLDGVTEDGQPSKLGANEIYFFGHSYTGEYLGDTDEDGTANGTGHFSGSDGRRTLELGGTFAEGIPAGEGKCTIVYQNEDREEYEGNFENGEYSGYGIRTYYYHEGDEQKRITKGEWVNGDDILDGAEDTDYYSDGTVRVYKGGWKGATWEGAGELNFTFPDDDERLSRAVIGSWKDGQLDGQVKITVTYRNGDVKLYEGGYSNDDMNGEGVLTVTYSNGRKTVMDGTWKDGDLVKGTTTNFDKDGKVKNTTEIGESGNS